ncbi:MAG: hypothetical protein AAF573_14720 [Bacteroidota bacterium]
MLKLLKLSTTLFCLIGIFSCSSEPDKNVNVSINVAENAPSAAEGFNLEQFHRLLIEEGESEAQWDVQFLSDLVNREDINNLDLNQNGYVDTILVEPFDDGEIKGFQLYTKVINRPGTQNDEEQTIATVMVEQEGDKGSLTVSGNENVYGHHHHYHSSGIGNFFLMYWLFSPRMMYGSAYYGTYRSGYAPRRQASTAAYQNKINNRNASYTGNKAPTATRPSTVKQAATQQKTAAKGIKSKLNNPTSSQRSFRAQSQAKSRSAASGFGKKSTGTRSNSYGGRTRSSGGK